MTTAPPPADAAAAAAAAAQQQAAQQAAAAAAAAAAARSYPDGLGDAGKRAIAAERDRAERAEKALRASQEAAMTDAQRAVEAAKTETETRIRAEEKAARDTLDAGHAQERLGWAVSLEAAGFEHGEGDAKKRVALADPSDAGRFLDLADPGLVDKDGKPSQTGIRAALAKLVEDRPYLAAAPAAGTTTTTGRTGATRPAAAGTTGSGGGAHQGASQEDNGAGGRPERVKAHLDRVKAQGIGRN